MKCRGRVRDAKRQVTVDLGVSGVGKVEAIRASIKDRGYPPSMRELGEAAGLASTPSVAHQIGA
ncbi:hypothetical protein [Streptomyces chartreusis]|uniref:LexA family protein n=1 Tax=Streptomyces chartreusis TaxID=1969 RepID=UPI0038654CB4